MNPAEIRHAERYGMPEPEDRTVYCAWCNRRGEMDEDGVWPAGWERIRGELCCRKCVEQDEADNEPRPGDAADSDLWKILTVFFWLAVMTFTGWGVFDLTTRAIGAVQAWCAAH